MFKRFGSLLSRQQEILMQKLIHNDSMHIDVAEEQDGKMMQQLYTLFFAWATEEEDNKDDAEKDFDQMDEEKRAEEERKEKEKRRKREEFQKEQALHDFEERGGFSQVLKDIFNPSDMAAMELDSVFQLKNICKDFYRKKQLMSTALI